MGRDRDAEFMKAAAHMHTRTGYSMGDCLDALEISEGDVPEAEFVLKAPRVSSLRLQARIGRLEHRLLALELLCARHLKGP